jgi:tetratricopeptide (TPR) repeat protein
LHIIPVGSAIVAERYTYVPYIGLFFIIGQLYCKAIDQKIKRKPLLITVFLIFTIFFSITTWNRNKVWKNSNTLFTDAIKKNPGGSSLIYTNLGASKFNLGDYIGAIKDFDKAIMMRPNHPNAYNNRGSSKFNLQDYEGAGKDYDKAINLDPKYADAYKNRGVLKYKLKDYIGSIEDYTKAIELNPIDAINYHYRGLSKSHINDMNGACEDWHKASQLGLEKANKKIIDNCK